ncbi:MAG: helicase C-terminal domain-containing protein, partial [Vulcanisaeta sp.]
MEIIDYVYSLLSDRKILLLNAYPGFGKSRIAIGVAKRWVDDGGKVLIMTRSRAEALQLCEFTKQAGIRDRTAVFLGRESLCPFKAHDSKQCMLYRMSGICRVRRVEIPSQILTCDFTDLFNFGLCPYEVNEALAYQLPMVIVTHAYLSSPELYSKLMDVVSSWDKSLVIIDEFHNVAAGLETSIDIGLDELRLWASYGNDIARK